MRRLFSLLAIALLGIAADAHAYIPDLAAKEKEVLSQNRTSGGYANFAAEIRAITVCKTLFYNENASRDTTIASTFCVTAYELNHDTDGYYAQQRFYQPQTGRFNRVDPVEGELLTPLSYHRYVYAWANPTVYVDPTGETSEERYAELIATAMTAWEEYGNRTALGTAGELQLERILERSGHTIVKGPSNNPGQHNADIVAFDPEENRIRFFDNKIQTAKATSSSAPNLSVPERRLRSIEEARHLMTDLDLDIDTRVAIAGALDEVEIDPAKADWIIANANPDTTKVNNLVSRISIRLARKGVRFADLQKGQLDIRNLERSIEGVRGAERFLERAGRSLPVIGTVVAGTTAAFRMDAALAEDLAYEQAITELGGEPLFPFQASEREGATILAEESASTLGGTLGAGVGALCGPFAWLCVPVGGTAGGFLGDVAGGALANWHFDGDESLSQSERTDILERVRDQMSRDGIRLTEDEQEP